MKKIFCLIFIFTFSSSTHAEYQVNVNFSKYGKEAIAFVKNKLNDNSAQLILNEIDIEYRNRAGEIIYSENEQSLKKDVYLLFIVVDLNSKRKSGVCDKYDRHIAKLKIDELSGFSYALGELKDCTDKSGPINDLLK